MQLSKELSISYKAAWYMLHRLHLACGSKIGALHGSVEVDGVYLGGLEENRHENEKLDVGGDAGGKQAVPGMRVRGGRTIAMPIPDTTKETVQGIIYDHVRSRSTIYTDESTSYTAVAHRHQAVNHSAKEYVSGMAHNNGIESVWAFLKRSVHGVYHNWSKKHCCAYINELTFRLNEGNCDRDTQGRLDDLFRGMAARPSPTGS